MVWKVRGLPESSVVAAALPIPIPQSVFTYLDVLGAVETLSVLTRTLLHPSQTDIRRRISIRQEPTEVFPSRPSHFRSSDPPSNPLVVLGSTAAAMAASMKMKRCHCCDCEPAQFEKAAIPDRPRQGDWGTPNETPQPELAIRNLPTSEGFGAKGDASRVIGDASRVRGDASRARADAKKSEPHALLTGGLAVAAVTGSMALSLMSSLDIISQEKVSTPSPNIPNNRSPQQSANLEGSRHVPRSSSRRRFLSSSHRPRSSSQ